VNLDFAGLTEHQLWELYDSVRRLTSPTLELFKAALLAEVGRRTLNVRHGRTGRER